MGQKSVGRGRFSTIVIIPKVLNAPLDEFELAGRQGDDNQHENDRLRGR